MRSMVLAGIGLVLLAGCSSKGGEPVGENSAGSVRTTAVGTIVGTEPSPTPSATPGDGETSDNTTE